MDKNKCPKLFLKKKFRKTEAFCIFYSCIEHSPFHRIYITYLSLYLSTLEEIESKINIGIIKMTDVQIPSLVSHFIFREK